MSHPVARSLGSAAISILLLLVGAALLISLFYLLASALGVFDDKAQPRSALTLYYKVVVLKGLLPQLLLTLALHPLLRRARVRGATRATRSEAIAPSRPVLLLELLVVSALAYSAVAPFLLTVDFPAWPALKMNSTGQQVETFLLMTGITGVGAWLPRLLPDRARRHSAPGAD